MLKKLLVSIVILFFSLFFDSFHASLVYAQKPTSSITPTPSSASCSSDFATLSASELLQILPTANYYCTESIAQALVPLADDSILQSLLSTINSSEQSLARQNAIRVIGRFAEQPSSTNAHTLVVITNATDVKNALLTRLQVDTDDNVLQDAIWVLDSFFYPYNPMQPSLETISTNTSYGSALRFRAITAVGRLLYAKTGVMSDHDVTYVTESLQSNDSWVRAEAAYIFQIIKDTQLDAATRDRITTALQTAYNVERVLTPRVYMAKALDRYNGNTLLFDGLQSSYEATHLPNQATGGNFTIRSGLSQDQLPAFLTEIQNEQLAFFQIMGSSFSTPVAGDTNTTMTLIVFATNQEYIDYMDSFVGYGGSAGGLYLEDEGKLYTYQRTPSESAFTVQELIQHEFGHYLQGRYIYPGAFSTPGYFDEAKAWADEGTAEFYAGMTFDARGSYATPVRQVELNRLCGRPFRDLTSLLTQTTGYDDPGVFDYANGWSFMYYLMTSRQQVAMNLYTAFRNNTYHYVNFASIAGVPSVDSLNEDWHSKMQDWCHITPTPTETPSPTPTVTPTPTPTPTITPSPTPSPSPSPTPSPTLSPTPATKTLNLTPTADAHVRKDKPTNNYGLLANLNTDSSPNTILFMKFNLSQLSGKKIISAKLILKVSQASGVTQALKRAEDKTWYEKTINYNNKPSLVNTIHTFNAGPVGGTIELDVINPVNFKKGSTLTLGITSSGNEITKFYSGEASLSNRPQLIIEYQ